jgi:hypothetical protein
MLPRDLRDSIGDLVKGTVPPELGLQAPACAAPAPGAAVACRRGTAVAGQGLVSLPPGASRPAAGASLV